MNKFRILVSLSFIGSLLTAQFNVNLNIEGSANEPFFVLLSQGSDFKFVNRAVTDNKGNLAVKIPTNYKGIVRLVNGQEQALDIFSDNEDIAADVVFDTAKGYSISKLSKGKAQRLYNEEKEYNKFKEFSNNTLENALELYNQSDEFYKQIKAEQTRIAGLQEPDLSSMNWLNSFVDLKNKLKGGASAINKNEAIKLIKNSGEFLENTGLLRDLVFLSLNDSFQATSEEDFINKFRTASNNLLNELDTTTERGQNVLEIILNTIPFIGISQPNVQTLESEFYSKLNSLDCKLTESLSDKKIAYNQIQEGKQFPNIVFNEKWKGKKSLYDVKADRKIVLFWASWCPACMNEMPFVQEYYNNFKNEGGELFAFSLDFEEQAFKDATKDFEWFNQSNLLKWKDPLLAKVGVNRTPTFFLLDGDNNILRIGNRITDVIEE